MDNFDEEVYQIVEQIPSGSVITYGEIARLMGKPGYARRVGYALGHIPDEKEKEIPAHRVVNSAGRLAPHWPEQRRLLMAEGVAFRSNGYVNLKVSLWKGLENTDY